MWWSGGAMWITPGVSSWPSRACTAGCGPWLDISSGRMLWLAPTCCTTQMGAGKPAGKVCASWRSAEMPPADEPMTTRCPVGESESIVPLWPWEGRRGAGSAPCFAAAREHTQAAVAQRRDAARVPAAQGLHVRAIALHLLEAQPPQRMHELRMRDQQFDPLHAEARHCGAVHPDLFDLVAHAVVQLHVEPGVDHRGDVLLVFVQRGRELECDGV